MANDFDENELLGLIEETVESSKQKESLSSIDLSGNKKLKSRDIKTLISNMSQEQKTRYDLVKNTHIDSALLRQVLQPSFQSHISSTSASILSALSKAYIGEIMETARDIMNENEENGHILPVHLRLAHQKLQNEKKKEKVY